jgi:hypothetical protein
MHVQNEAVALIARGGRALEDVQLHTRAQGARQDAGERQAGDPRAADGDAVRSRSSRGRQRVSGGGSSSSGRAELAPHGAVQEWPPEAAEHSRPRAQAAKRQAASSCKAALLGMAVQTIQG